MKRTNWEQLEVGALKNVAHWAGQVIYHEGYLDQLESPEPNPAITDLISALMVLDHVRDLEPKRTPKLKATSFSFDETPSPITSEGQN